MSNCLRRRSGMTTCPFVVNHTVSSFSVVLICLSMTLHRKSVNIYKVGLLLHRRSFGGLTNPCARLARLGVRHFSRFSRSGPPPSRGRWLFFITSALCSPSQTPSPRHARITLRSWKQSVCPPPEAAQHFGQSF